MGRDQWPSNCGCEYFALLHCADPISLASDRRPSHSNASTKFVLTANNWVWAREQAVTPQRATPKYLRQKLFQHFRPKRLQITMRTDGRVWHTAIGYYILWLHIAQSEKLNHSPVAEFVMRWNRTLKNFGNYTIFLFIFHAAALAGPCAQSSSSRLLSTVCFPFARYASVHNG